MKKLKRILSLCLAIIIACSFTAVVCQAAPFVVTNNNLESGFSSGYDSYTPQEKLELVFQFLLKNSLNVPKMNQIQKELSDGDLDAFRTDVNDPDTSSAILELLSWTHSNSQVIQTFFLTVNPRNTERFQIPAVQISAQNSKDSSSQFETWLKSIPRTRTVFVSLPMVDQNALVLEPFLAYPDPNNNLVIWCILQNQSSEEKQLKGFYSVQFNSGSKVIARGFPSAFTKPIVLSPTLPNSQQQASLKNGIPNRCLVRFTFAPGTYDQSVILGDADTLTGSFEPIK